MATSVLSTRGQIVIPVEFRKRAGLSAGDSLLIEFDEDSQELRLKKAETIDEMVERFTAYIAPGTPPLQNASALYRQRSPRSVLQDGLRSGK